jgi:nucleoside-diphosphate-sugar epimerase
MTTTMWAGRGSPVFVAAEGVDDPLRDELRVDDVAPAAVLAGADIDVRGVAVGTGALAVAPAVRELCPHEASANASAGVRTTPTARRFTSLIIRRRRATRDRPLASNSRSLGWLPAALEGERRATETLFSSL